MVALPQQLVIAIQHQHGDISWLQKAPLQHVRDTSKRTRDDVGAGCEALFVFVDGSAANAGVARDAASGEESCDVDRNFARRGYDQH